MKVLNVTDEAHAAAKSAAASAGTSMTQWASERLTAPDAPLITPFFKLGLRLGDAGAERLSRMASARSQSPAETLSAALDALERPAGAVRPERVETPAGDEHGAWCRCDGETAPGAHHKVGCHRRAA